MTKLFRNALGAWLAIAGSFALSLTAVLILANSGPFSASAFVELLAAMLWVCGALNLVFLVFLVAAWPVVARLAPGWAAGIWFKYLVAGLVAANVAWILWNRLTMAHQWVSWRPFMTWTGVVENFSLIIISLSMVLAGVRFLRWRRIDRICLAFGMIGLLMAATVLAWNRYEERQVRTFTLDQIRIAAGLEDATGTGERASDRGGPVILLGVDGFSWNVLVPLLEAGRLPAVADLIRNGAWGYLDNGDDSLSPIIWPSVFTGRVPEAHGTRGFHNLKLPRSKTYIENLLVMKPAMETFYGLARLLQEIPNPGLWKMTDSTTKPRVTPFIWEILSFYGRSATVVDPMVIDKDKAVNGSMIMFREANPDDTSYAYPRGLAERWRKVLESEEYREDLDRLGLLSRRFDEESDFAMTLMQEFDSEARIYYLHYLDSAAHYNWDFFAPDAFFFSRTPRSLSDEEWKRVVLDNIDNPGFAAYLRVDRLVQRVVGANPEATIVIVSDHGWGYSGYEHFGSPSGVLILSGPGIRSGVVLEDASILDIAPTVLALMDVPVSDEFDGRVLSEAIDAGIVPRSIVHYPAGIADDRRPGDSRSPEQSDVRVGQDEEERLRALGYIQ